ncbi:F-box protein CPR1-like isoform X1 [Rhodamnia argentea]|uniref:F-box protein CPR1-like n=1 Tax=Rhodamnia argentea TaxID=178133 RepID=A0A8B8R0L7_9MYRT|nr:F-box protein CPR1-like isoform X1 [Rhodamnia argentea]XP_048131775.1 F-box protein CPR1-like isoform X1 [Rhodamnia argentea]XP_048131776.1 F-box protein CPR1-like isoform X1 [Rhodamnia argentea]
MGTLPIELITEILDRLPVESLLRFRCVSRRWRSTIDSPRFVKSHLSRSVESSTNLSLFLRHSSSLYCLDLGSLRSVVEMNYPLMCYSDQIKVLGSCHGLLCISNAADDVVIWNPSTRKHKFLPYSAVEVRRASAFSVCVYGFGYDDGNDDYMLLRLVQLVTEPIESEVSIYSLKNNAWKRLHDMPYSLVYPRKMGVFACRRLHWIMTRELVSDSANLLVAFDFRIEDFKLVDQPDVIDNKLDMDVAVLGGCLCLSINDNHMGVDVWIMKDYGLKESWAKLFSIPQSEVARPLGFARPLAYSQNGRQVLVRQDSKNLVWYHLETKCIKKVNISGMPSSFEAEICLRTLVSVDDYGGITKKRQQQLEEKENRNKRDDFLSVGFKLVL